MYVKFLCYAPELAPSAPPFTVLFASFVGLPKLVRHADLEENGG